MKVVDSPIPQNIWLEIHGKLSPTIPDGYESKDQISKKISRGESQTKMFIKKMLVADLLDVFVAPNGKKFYRPKDYGKTPLGQKHRRHR